MPQTYNKNRNVARVVKKNGYEIEVIKDLMFLDVTSNFQEPFDVKRYAKTKPKIENGRIIEEDVDHLSLYKDYKPVLSKTKDISLYFNMLLQIGLCVKYARGKNQRDRYYADSYVLGMAEKFITDVLDVASIHGKPVSQIGMEITSIIVSKGWKSLFGNVLNAAKFIESKTKKKTII